jgi:PAS domain S-box-containing protein
MMKRPREVALRERARQGVVLVRARDAAIVHANSAFEWMFGYGPGELEGQPFGVVNEAATDGTAMAVALAAHGGWSGELEHVRKDGTRFTCWTDVSPFEHPEHGTLWISVHTESTQQRRAEDDPGQAAAIIESSADAIIGKTLDGVITTWNAGAERIYGYSAEEVVGRPMSLLVPPEYEGDLPSILERVKNGDKVQDVETRRIRKNGTAIDVSLTISPIKDAEGRIVGTSTIARDITERRRAEEAVVRAEKRFRGLLESAPDAMVIVDGDARIVLVNAQTERLFGYSREDLIGRDVETLLPERFRAAHRGHRYGFLAAPSARPMGAGLDLFGRREDGSEFPVDIALSPLETDEGRLVASSIRDVTERKASEEALRLLARRLDRSNRDLEEFASSASHDLREPLRKVQAFGDRLRTKYGDALPPEGHEYLGRMIGAADRMESLVDGLLALSRVGAGEKPFSDVDLATVARGVLSDLETRIEQSGGRVQLGRLPTIEAEPTEMRQLLLNLVGNAIKFHKPGHPPQVEVAAQLDGGECRLIVSDDGIGFEEKYLDRMFEPFQRLGKLSDYEGAGIGLALCRKIAERHCGGMSARSVPGEGSTFVVTLPLQQTADALPGVPGTGPRPPMLRDHAPSDTVPARTVRS